MKFIASYCNLNLFYRCVIKRLKAFISHSISTCPFNLIILVVSLKIFYYLFELNVLSHLSVYKQVYIQYIELINTRDLTSDVCLIFIVDDISIFVCFFVRQNQFIRFPIFNFTLQKKEEESDNLFPSHVDDDDGYFFN